MKLLLFLTILLLLLVNLFLLFSAFVTKSWSIIKSDKTLGLFSCTDCDQFKDNWNFECLARSTCENENKIGECNLYKDLYKGSFSFLVFEFASLLMAILFIEKLILIILRFPSGTSVSSLGIPISMFLFHLLGTFIWFGYTEAGSSCSAEKDSEKRPSICISSGSSIIIANCILMGITLGIFIYSFINTEIKEEVHYIHKPFLWISGTIWLYTSQIFAFITLALNLASLTVEDWVKSENYSGSLLRCSNCDTIKWMSWSCLQGTACSANNDSHDCQNYKKFALASQSFLSLQGFSLILFALYIQNLTAFVRRREYGWKYLNYVKNI